MDISLPISHKSFKFSTCIHEIWSPFQRQTTTIISGYSNGFGFRDTRWQLLLSPNFKFTTKKQLFKNCRQMSLKWEHFTMLIYRTYEQLRPIYDNVSGTGRARQIGCPDARDNQKIGLGNQILEASCPGGNQRFCQTFKAREGISRPILNIYRHTIHQIEADYHSYLMVSIM